MFILVLLTLCLKVWGLTIHNLLYTFSSERSRSSRFRSSGTAISELYLGPNGRLFSSSTDGSLKLRQLTYKHNIVNTWQNESQTDVTHFWRARMSVNSEILDIVEDFMRLWISSVQIQPP